MAILIIEHGPDEGRQFQLAAPHSILGRQADTVVCLTAKAVSRQHARISQSNGVYLLEDLNSSNGTYLNGNRIQSNAPVPLTEQDKVQIGPYVLALCPEPTLTPNEDSLVIRDQISAVAPNESIYGQAPAQKLQVVLEISQNLAGTLDMESVLEKLLDQLMRLFPHADRAMILLLEENNLVVRGQRCRYAQEASTYPYSRTVVKRALDDGVGIRSDDVQDDTRFDSSATLASLNLHSLLCVPLICPDGRRLGVLQVDRFQRGTPFRNEDLQLLTAIGLQVAVVLDNAHLHSVLLKEERLRQELELARDVQQEYLPSDFEEFTSSGLELFACVHPARTVSGDLYDLHKLPDGRVAFLIGDVSGKGMPAALLTVSVRTLSRHLFSDGHSPAESLTELNKSLTQEFPAGKFVTLAHGLCEPKTGRIQLATGGHPLPLIRHPSGAVDELPYRPGRPLGFEDLPLTIKDIEFVLAPGDCLVFYTDGLLESRDPTSKELFGMKRIKDLVRQFDNKMALTSCANLARQTIQDYTGSADLQDDLTLLLLRRS